MLIRSADVSLLARFLPAGLHYRLAAGRKVVAFLRHAGVLVVADSLHADTQGLSISADYVLLVARLTGAVHLVQRLYAYCLRLLVPRFFLVSPVKAFRSCEQIGSSYPEAGFRRLIMAVPVSFSSCSRKLDVARLDICWLASVYSPRTDRLVHGDVHADRLSSRRLALTQV